MKQSPSLTSAQVSFRAFLDLSGAIIFLVCACAFVNLASSSDEVARDVARIHDAGFVGPCSKSAAPRNASSPEEAARSH
jgi:hypothetical protein